MASPRRRRTTPGGRGSARAPSTRTRMRRATSSRPWAFSSRVSTSPSRAASCCSGSGMQSGDPGTSAARRRSSWRPPSWPARLPRRCVCARGARLRRWRRWLRGGDEVDGTLVDLLREALGRLPDRDSLVRVRVMGRLAVELSFVDAAKDERLELAEAAVEMAERIGDPRVSSSPSIAASGPASGRTMSWDNLPAPTRYCASPALSATGRWSSGPATSASAPCCGSATPRARIGSTRRVRS